MKKTTAMAMILVLLLYISGCSNSANWDTSKMEKGVDISEITSKAVSAILKEVTVASNTQSLTLMLTNNTAKELSYGKEPHLEVQTEGEWYVVPLKKGTTVPEIGILLPPNGTNEYKVNLSDYYENLKTGHYRYLKTFADGIVSVEFDIE